VRVKPALVGTAFLAFRRHKIQYGTHFYSAQSVCSSAVYESPNWAYERRIRGENL